MSAETLLHLDQLQIGYLGRSLLPPISLQFGQGEFWGIVGSNGSGKSTLLRTMLGLQPAIGGRVTRSSGLRVGYVPQRMSLDLSMPARAIDVIRGGTVRDWSLVNPLHTWRSREVIAQAMAQTHVTDLARSQLTELSEGQKQRVLMARALASRPQILVLDEPTSAMDHQTETEMLGLLDRLREELGLGIVLVSHNLMGMATVASHALMLDREHQLILQGDIREVAVHHEVHEHFGRLLRTVVEDRFGPLPDPEECHACEH
jgi:zinc transport system ATP-binding protein